MNTLLRQACGGRALVYAVYLAWVSGGLWEPARLIFGRGAGVRAMPLAAAVAVLLILSARRLSPARKLIGCAVVVLMVMTINWSFILVSYYSYDMAAFPWMLGIALVTYAIAAVCIRLGVRVALESGQAPLRLIGFIALAALIAGWQFSVEYSALGGMLMQTY